MRGQGASGGEAGGLHSGTTHPLQQRNGHTTNLPKLNYTYFSIKSRYVTKPLNQFKQYIVVLKLNMSHEI